MKRLLYLLAYVVAVFYPVHISQAAEGDLVKSQVSSAVYYVFQGKRLAFPNELIFFSWYTNFNSVTTISSTALADLPLAGSVWYRPGVQLVKLTTDPKVYAVSRGGVLRWVQTEEVATQLYGPDWAKKVHDLSDAFFPGYRIGESIGLATAYRPAQEMTEVSVIGQNVLAPSTARSAFFQGNDTFTKVLQGTPLDVSVLHMWNPANYVEKTGFAYKLLAALMMVGYNPHIQTDVDRKHLTMLQLFQKNNGFSINNNLTPEAAKKLDEQLVKREAELALSAQAFPLYGHMGPLASSEVSKDYLATLYSLPIQQLPESLRLNGEQEYVDCIKVQCLGFVQPDGTAPTPYWNAPIDISKPYVFSAAYYDPQREIGLPGIQNAATVMHTVLHEYAHALDKTKIDTKSYYEIVNGIGRCDQNKDGLSPHFLTRYGLLKATENCSQRTDKTLYASEDFADSFAAYVMWGKQFRSAATKDTFISKRYQWLKGSIFQGKEFDTEFPGLPSAGCSDDKTPAPSGTGQYDFPYNKPGYVSCNEEYVWDGMIIMKAR